jgi:hypothetical protein
LTAFSVTEHQLLERANDYEKLIGISYENIYNKYSDTLEFKEF